MIRQQALPHGQIVPLERIEIEGEGRDDEEQ
jgi:hypothetical protein